MGALGGGVAKQALQRDSELLPKHKHLGVRFLITPHFSKTKRVV